MPLSVPRLRTWFGILALATVAVVAGFYFYARIQLRKIVREAPQKLGVEIQQSTQGFSFSKSEGGRTLFTIRAGKAVQYKDGGRATLQDVNIIVYGRDGNRFDQISGSGFEYDPQSGIVKANGEVNIDLEANTLGPMLPDQQVPKELKNPIHLTTSGLVFNQKTGFAETREKIQFEVPQARGEAVGAAYDSKSNVLTLQSNVKIETSGPHETTINAQQGLIRKEPAEMILERVHVAQTTRTVDANNVAVRFRPNNEIESVVATGDVRLMDKGKNELSVQAPRADLDLAQKNILRRAVFSGGVQIDGRGKSAMNGTAGTLALDFAGQNKLSHVRASNTVHVQQTPEQASGDAYDLTTNALDLAVRNGKTFEYAETAGPGQVILTPQKGTQGERTVITADRFHAEFDGDNRLKAIHGEPNARMVASTAGQPDKVATAREMLVNLAPGGIREILMNGTFQYNEAAGAKGVGPGGRTAVADKARYNPADETLTLTGSPRATDGGLEVSADTIRINRRTGDAFASGDVKSTYNQLKQDPNGALLATSEPVHATAPSMSAQRNTGIARYTGGARLWQGANIVEAPAIEFNRQQRSIVAQGPSEKEVQSVFVQTDKNGKTTPVVVTAQKLTYVDSDRRARFTGGVVAKGADLTVSADAVDVILNPAGHGKQPNNSPSQLNQIVALNHVVIQETGRRATGDKLVYTAANGEFVLTGGPPMILDAEHGTIRGDSLTFYSHEDKIVVASGNSSRTVTHTRVTR
ncbi:MAG TPA: LPS export ABC transporter periplasmic protein LptC [Terriglobales bacterium]|nr:LPS export ABC transporter periplasmic protein LptC [Terriglobales bacterium]